MYTLKLISLVLIFALGAYCQSLAGSFGHSQGSILRPMAAGEDDRVAPAAPEKPIEERIIECIGNSLWQYTLKANNTPNYDNIRSLFTTLDPDAPINEEHLRAFNEKVREFNGSIYFVPEDKMDGRTFWFSGGKSAPTIYFYMDAIKRIGLLQVTALLSEIQLLVNKNRCTKINRLPIAREVKRRANEAALAQQRQEKTIRALYKRADYLFGKEETQSKAMAVFSEILRADPDRKKAAAYACGNGKALFDAGRLDESEQVFEMVASLLPDHQTAGEYLGKRIPARRAQLAADKEKKEEKRASEEGLALTEAAPVRLEAISNKMVNTANDAWNRIAPPNTVGLNMRGEEMVVWLDISDCKAPGFNFVELELPSMPKRTPLRCTPLMPFIRKAPTRYMASIPLNKIKGYLKTIDPDASMLLEQIAADLDDDLLTRLPEPQNRWLSETVAIMEKMLEEREANFKKVEAKHRVEVERIVKFILNRYQDLARLNRTARKARQYLKDPKRSGSGEIDQKTFCYVADLMNDALEPWFPLQSYVQHRKRHFAIDAKEPLAECIKLFGFRIVQEAHLKDIFDFYGVAPADILAEAYYASCSHAWLKRIKELKGYRGDDVVCEVYLLGKLVSTLAQEEAFTRKVEKINPRHMEPKEEIFDRQIGVTGALLLDSEGKAKRFIPGGGAVVPSGGFGPYFSPYKLEEWYRKGDKIVLVYPSVTSGANYPQVRAYANSLQPIQKNLPGVPEVLLGTQNIIDGGLTFFKPVGSDYQDCWRRLLNAVLDKQTGWDGFGAFLDREVYVPPRAKSGKGMKRLRVVDARAVRKQEKLQYIHEREEEEYSRIRKVAQTLPEIIQRGIIEFFGQESGERIMTLVRNNNELSSRFKKVAQDSRRENIDMTSLYNDEICKVAWDVECFIAKCVADDILSDNEIFEKMEVEGLSNRRLPPVIQVQKEAVTQGAQAGPGQERGSNADAEKISIGLIKQCGEKHSDIFRRDQKGQWEGFVRQWVGQRLLSGEKTRYTDLESAWLAEQKKVQEDAERARLEAQRREAESIRVEAEAKRIHDEAVQKAQELIDEVNLVTGLVETYDDDTIGVVDETCGKVDKMLARLDVTVDADLQKILREAALKLKRKLEELNLSPVQKEAKALCDFPGYALACKEKPELAKAVKGFLDELINGKKYDVKDRLRRQVKYEILHSVGPIHEFYEKVFDLTQASIEPSQQKAAQAIDSSILRPMAAGEDDKAVPGKPSAKRDERRTPSEAPLKIEYSKREKLLMDYGVYTEAELIKVKTLYEGFLKAGSELQSFNGHQIVLLWQYMIVAKLNETEKTLFGILDNWIKTKLNKNREINLPNFTYYIGYHHSATIVNYRPKETVKRFREILRQFHDRHLPSDRRYIRILDAGCGNGSFAIALAKTFGKKVFVVGADADPFNIAEAIDKLEKSGKRKNLQFLLGDISRLNQKENPFFKENYFDVVFVLGGLMDGSTYSSEAFRKSVADGISSVIIKQRGESADPTRAMTHAIAMIIFQGKEGDKAISAALKANRDINVKESVFENSYDYQYGQSRDPEEEPVKPVKGIRWDITEAGKVSAPSQEPPPYSFRQRFLFSGI